jgi:hypothetical protein
MQRSLEALRRARGRLEQMQGQARARNTEARGQGQRDGAREGTQEGGGGGPREGEPGGAADGRRVASGEPGRAPGSRAAPGDPTEWADSMRQAADDLTRAGRDLAGGGEIAGGVSRLGQEIERLAAGAEGLRSNPALLDRELEAALKAAAPLEERLRRLLDTAAGGTVRVAPSADMPAEHRDAIAEYYRRLSETR